MARGNKRKRQASPAGGAAQPAEPALPPAKPRRTYDKPCAFLAAWLWKRESKSDEERFDAPYEYPFAGGGVLTIAQRRFGPEARLRPRSAASRATRPVTMRHLAATPGIR